MGPEFGQYRAMSDATMDRSPRAPRGPRPRNFRCPGCGVAQAGKVTSTKSNRGGQEIVRRLRCERCEMSYSTVERVVRQGLEHLQVLTASGEYRPFSRTRIENDVALWVRKTLSAEEITYVVDAVCQDLEQLLGSVVSSPSSGLVGSVPPNRSNPRSPYVKPWLIVQYVNKALERSGERVQGVARDRYRSARAQFGLAYFGRRHPEASPEDELPVLGDARSVAAWLSETFGVGGRSDLSRLASGRSALLSWQPPDGHDWRPQRVIKNFRPVDGEIRPPVAADQVGGDPGSEVRPAKEVLRRTVVDFNENRLRESIRAALRGRRNRHTEDVVVQWVCLGLTGQRVVRTSQLSAGVAECLRMLDDVGYLRWVAIGKELTVEDLYEEALNVMRYPSPQLEFRQRKAPVFRPSVQVTMAQDAVTGEGGQSPARGR